MWATCFRYIEKPQKAAYENLSGSRDALKAAFLFVETYKM